MECTKEEYKEDKSGVKKNGTPKQNTTTSRGPTLWDRSLSSFFRFPSFLSSLPRNCKRVEGQEKKEGEKKKKRDPAATPFSGSGANPASFSPF